MLLRAKRQSKWQQRSCRRVTVFRLSLEQLRACHGEEEISSLQSAHVLGMSSRGGSPRRRRVAMVAQRSVYMGEEGEGCIHLWVVLCLHEARRTTSELVHSALSRKVEVVVEDLLGERALQALQLGDALVVRDDLVRVQRQHAQTRR